MRDNISLTITIIIASKEERLSNLLKPTELICYEVSSPSSILSSNSEIQNCWIVFT